MVSEIRGSSRAVASGRLSSHLNLQLCQSFSGLMWKTIARGVKEYRLFHHADAEAQRDTRDILIEHCRFESPRLRQVSGELTRVFSRSSAPYVTIL
ncbi:hypothetical protein EYF80_025709 [Liparis tanakae]|uniref:Uncharacterized protein n=1 Tax=Liparis tanakae TaxID=230148 RepID=A0A4Z2HEP3_9TELE|nr:hypothetical protein EYF80_025709 [Liparis tanakae]